MEASVSEIRAYPARSDGFEEPLFLTRESRLAVAEHLLKTPWLSRASGLAERGRGGRTVHARREPVEVENRGGRVRVVRAAGRECARGCDRGAWIAETLARWREVGWWWDEGDG